MTRVLMVSKACVTRTYRDKLTAMCRGPEGVELTLVVPPAWGTLSYEAAAGDEPFMTHVVPIAQNGHHHWHWYRGGLGGLMDRVRPDLVHIDEEHYSFVTWRTLGEAQRRRIPSVFFTWQNIDKTYPWPFGAMEATVLRGAAGAIAGNQEAEAILRRKGFTRPITVIPQFGTDPALFHPAPSPLRSAWGLEGRTVVGYVGRLIADKGLETLTAAAQPLLAARPDLVLVFQGSGPFEESLHAWHTRSNLGDRVRFAPWMASDQMPDLMNLLDILVLPSLTTARWKEQFGRVLTEAMASGVAVVGSSSGEIPSVIGDAGLVFPEGDVEALRASLARLVEDDGSRRAVGEAGRRRVLDRFTQDAVASATLAFYRQILEAHHHP